MANPERGEVSFEADGKTWVLRYSTNALCELEDALGQKVPAIVQGMQVEDGVGLKPFRTIFWAGLIDRQPGTSVSDAGGLIDALTLTEASVLVGKAFEAAFPPDGDSARPRKGSRAGTGKTS